MVNRRARIDLGRMVVTLLAVVASCTSFEKSSVEPQGRFGFSETGGSGGVIQVGTGGRGPVGLGGFGAAGTGGTNGTSGLTGASGSSCGNSRLDFGEQCDRQDFGNATCATHLMNPSAMGFLLCSPNCTVSIDYCTGLRDAGVGGIGGTVGAGGIGGGGVAGMIGVDASTCTPRGAPCAEFGCCPNLACWGTCCGALRTFCTVDGDCCPFDLCQNNGCCHAYAVPCVIDSDCCSGSCVASQCS